MNQKSDLSQSSPKSNQAASVGAGLAIAFILILLLMHFLEPEFDPSSRLISEYETGYFGWMMRLAFFFWGGSALALVIALWHSLRTVGGMIGRIWLVLLGLALFGAGIFATNAVTDTTPRLSNTIHGVCGAFVIFSFPIVATLIAASLARNPNWAMAQRRLFWGTLLAWLGLIAFFGMEFVSNAITPLAGLGWPNRFMVIVYNIWLIIVGQRTALTTMKKVVKTPQ
jgi:hypothetical protein